jgi:MoxR-like ATPase
VLLEGLPGLAKTLAVRTLAALVDGKFQRVQFTPDLLPADLLGTMIYNQQTGDFIVQRGPIFANFVLADEINRAPPKVQSALLEAMQERQITIGGRTFPLEEPFVVLGTQNPIEHEGTYPLPEAQVDRFMLKVIAGYPARDEEGEMLDRMAGAPPAVPRPVVSALAIVGARQVVNDIAVDVRVRDYVLDVVRGTRDPRSVGLTPLVPFIQFGVSPRAAVALVRAAKAHAFLDGRSYVTPSDIKAMAPDVLRHRLILTYEADAERVTTDQIIAELLDKIRVP